MNAIEYDRINHQNHADFEAGRMDAVDFNPTCNPGTRTGSALDAYESGWEFGCECLGEYFEEQEEC